MQPDGFNKNFNDLYNKCSNHKLELKECLKKNNIKKCKDLKYKYQQCLIKNNNKKTFIIE